ncbi:MAG: 23S rRNA (uracil(1939)-C(5))-methyltransferase RlmD [Oscillospiraceae bacterium]|nr:23S rRNA (uracil(1939)-C(5))-methyltransferase RlmD [Oscillospiraceae bacterium]MDY2863697.1 23S rRNA (uracil(1939)-C(5))-methyltransferase RlmD [Oscillospiraceae bacterium]
MTEQNKKEEQANSCPIYKKCSGCQLRNMTYEEQLRFKQIKVDRLMGKLCRPDRIIPAENPEGYRCKVQGAFDFKNGKCVSGVYQSSKGGVTAVERCPVNDERADRIIRAVKKTALSLKIPVWCSFNGRGFLRHVLVRIARNTGEIMAIIVGSSENFPSKAAFVKELMKKCPEITTLIFSVNRSEKMTVGDRCEVLFGKGYIEDIICGKRFRISPKSFAQVNPAQAERLYELAVRSAKLTGKETVIDAYCGIGAMSLIAADKAKKVYGCEINKAAVNDAVINAKLNGAENIEFICSDSGKFLAEFNDAKLKADVVILDPARAGCDRKFLTELVRTSPERIVYVSCEPETQSRDVFFLIKSGYRLKKLMPVDMFPFTNHVECVALLTKTKE